MRSEDALIVAVTGLTIALLVTIVALVWITVGRARHKWRMEFDHDINTWDDETKEIKQEEEPP